MLNNLTTSTLNRGILATSLFSTCVSKLDTSALNTSELQLTTSTPNGEMLATSSLNNTVPNPGHVSVEHQCFKHNNSGLVSLYLLLLCQERETHTHTHRHTDKETDRGIKTETE